MKSKGLGRQIVSLYVHVFVHPSVYLFGILRRFQHCTGHITTGSWKGRGNQYIEFARFVYCKLPTNGKQLPAFPLTAMTGIDPRPQRWCIHLCIHLSGFNINLNISFNYKDIFIKFAGNVYGYKNLSRQNFGLILKNKMAAIANCLKIIKLF